MSVVVPVPDPEVEGDTPAEVEVEPEQTDSTEIEGTLTERTGLLDNVEDSGTNYNSDGETQVSPPYIAHDCYSVVYTVRVVTLGE